MPIRANVKKRDFRKQQLTVKSPCTLKYRVDCESCGDQEWRYISGRSIHGYRGRPPVAICMSVTHAAVRLPIISRWQATLACLSLVPVGTNDIAEGCTLSVEMPTITRHLHRKSRCLVYVVRKTDALYTLRSSKNWLISAASFEG